MSPNNGLDLRNIPRISIITPSFNQGEFLEECIDSVLSQNYPNLEYIIMDGGSTDNSVEIIKRYEKYLTYWQSKPDKGQYDAINEGFKRTTGEIMAWLNSDDKYHHNAFYKISYIFSKYPLVAWLTGRSSEWSRNGDFLNILWGALPEFSREKYLKKDFMSPSIQQESTFWRRSLWIKAGGYIKADLNYAGDLELWTRFFRFSNLHIADTLLGGYRKHGNQKAELFKDKYIEEAEEILQKELELFQNGKFKDLLPISVPVILSRIEIKSYIDSLYASTRHEIYKISDDSESIIRFFLNSEEVIKAALVIVLRKFRLYNFYVKHEPGFSRVYHFIRRFFATKPSQR